MSEFKQARHRLHRRRGDDHCAREILWLRSLFDEIGSPQLHPTLYCDNQGIVQCIHDPQSHSYIKHIDIRTHFIRDAVNLRLIDVHHIPGTENPADIIDMLTKPLNRTVHQKWLTRI